MTEKQVNPAKEKGVPFMAAMARAVRRKERPKTQTRRVVKAEVPAGIVDFCSYHHPNPGHWLYGWDDVQKCLLEFAMRSPYGGPGDRLWVREHWRTRVMFDALPPRDLVAAPIRYEADKGEPAPGDGFWGKFRPGMFMPRWATRTLLELTDVRVERLQSTSESDAMAEGCVYHEPANYLSHGGWSHDGRYVHKNALDSYKQLWESINGAGSWDLNPLVWVNTFKRVEACE